MINKVSRNEMRKGRHDRVKAKLVGNEPRVNDYKSNSNIFAQII